MIPYCYYSARDNLEHFLKIILIILHVLLIQNIESKFSSIYIYVCICICICICIYIYIYTYICIYVYMYIHIYIFILYIYIYTHNIFSKLFSTSRYLIEFQISVLSGKCFFSFTYVNKTTYYEC